MADGPESVEFDQGGEDAAALLELMAYLHCRRVGQGMSLKNAARQMGMKKKQLEQLEAGIITPYVPTAQRYARLLGYRLTFGLKAGEVGRG